MTTIVIEVDARRAHCGADCQHLRRSPGAAHWYCNLFDPHGLEGLKTTGVGHERHRSCLDGERRARRL